MTPTTRRYSRSIAEAFPDVRADSGDWNHPRATNIGHWVVNKFSLYGLIVLVACLLVGAL